MDEAIFLSLRQIDEFPECASPVDEEYLSQFTDERRKKESIVARLELNRLALLHAKSSLAQLGFAKTKKGKPIIDSELHCSISHSAGWVFVGLGSVPFGIDIEQMNASEFEFLEHAYSKEEWDRVRAQPEQAFMGFSVKEATAKKDGTGFLTDPATIQPSKSDHVQAFHMATIQGERFVLTVCAERCVPADFDLPQGIHLSDFVPET